MSELWDAIVGGDTDGLVSLLAAGGDPDETVSGLPLLDHAVLEWAVLEWAVLEWAVLDGKPGVDCVRVLLEHGADPNLIETGRGWTPLFFAAQANEFRMMRVLLDAGTDHSVVDVDGKTALHVAVVNARGDLTGVRMLLGAGADPDAEDRFGKSPRAIAELIANFHTKDAFVGL